MLPILIFQRYNQLTSVKYRINAELNTTSKY